MLRFIIKVALMGTLLMAAITPPVITDCFVWMTRSTHRETGSPIRNEQRCDAVYPV